MRPIQGVFFAALLACAQVCAAFPRAESEGRDVHKIAWNKHVEGEAFRDEHGVCHAFARDTRAGLQTLGDQVKACFERALPERRVETPEAKSVKVAWNRAAPGRLDQLYAESAERKNALYMTSARRRTAPPLLSVRGFFTQAGDTCHVVVPDLPDYVRTLGHESKHCVDGLFHDHHGEWNVAERG
jgi:hypothetical protein